MSGHEEKSLSFETAFHRLEEILEKMNSNEIGLDESIKLYEEADKLIKICSKQLHDAEKRVEVLIKNRDGSLALNAEQKPALEPWKPHNHTI